MCHENRRTRSIHAFKLDLGDINCTLLSPFKSKDPNKTMYIPNRDKHCLSADEAEKVYDCIDNDRIVDQTCTNTNTFANLPSHIETIRLSERDLGVIEECDEEEESNPYEDFLLNEVDLPELFQLGNNTKKHWSILTTRPKYVTPEFYNNKQSQLKLTTPHLKLSNKFYKTERDSQFRFADSCKEEKFLDNFNDLQAELASSIHFNESVDVSITYLGRQVMKRNEEFRDKYTFPIDHHSYTLGKLVQTQTRMRILLDTGATKCYLSYEFYQKQKELQKLPKFMSKHKSITVGNGQQTKIHFVIPIIVEIFGHLFEIFASVSEIFCGTQLVIGIKNMVELEGNISPRKGHFKFLNRALPVFPTEKTIIPPGGQASIKIHAPFADEISANTIVKIMDGPSIHTLQLKMSRNISVVSCNNTGNTNVIIDPDIAIGILDLRSIGYFRITHNELQLSLKQFSFARLDEICDTYNKMVDTHNTKVRKIYKHKQHVDNIIGKNKEQITKNKIGQQSSKYPWLEKSDPRNNMTDEQILHKYIDLSEAKLNTSEKDQLMELICKYKKAFSLRDEIGECPNIKIEIDLLDKSPFFVRPFSINEADKPFMDWQMQRLVSLGILSRNSTSHTSPVMLITRKVTQDKRPVVDFRLLNSRILRRNTATPLLKDIFSILGNSKCEVFSCLDLKDAYHSIHLTDSSKEYCGILPYFGSPHYRYERLPMGLSISPAKFIEYTNVLLDSLPDRNKYIAIMDDLLVHSLFSDHFEKLEILFEALIKHGLKLSPKKCQLFRTQLTYLGNVFTIHNRHINIQDRKSVV